MTERWTDFSFSLEIDDLLRGEGTDPDAARRRPALVAAAQEALRIGTPALRPAALVREVAVRDVRHERIVLEGDAVLTGPQVMSVLAGAERIAAAICTIGPGPEELASARGKEDPVLGLALDGLGNAAVEALGQQVCRRIGERALAAGLEASTPLSPGSPDWPVEIGQPQIFALLDASRAGIRLTGGGMMIPKKTISFVVGVGKQMARLDPCELCSLKEHCRHRHA